MKKNTLTYYTRRVYGVLTIYPENDAAHHIAAIAGTKTLTPRTLKLAGNLGFELKQVNDPMMEVKI